MRYLQDDGANATGFIDINSWCENPESTEAIVDCSILDNLNALEEKVQEISNGLDIFFLMMAGALEIFMQCGFAMVCAGTVQAKNVKNTLLKMIVDTCTTSLIFFCVGHAFAFGSEDQPSFIGSSDFFLTDERSMTGHYLIRFFFQLGFVANCATIVCCSIVERSQFVSYICYSIWLSGFVYPIVARSIWSPAGFLYAGSFKEVGEGNNFFDEVGVIDFAGSGVVHTTGGISALIAAIVLGPRLGLFYDMNGKSLEKPKLTKAHSSALQILGTFVLWFGWYGFNGGSAHMVSTDESSTLVALCAVTTTLAAAAGALSSLFLDTYLHFREDAEISYSPTHAMNGALSGLVAITAGCAVVAPWAAVAIGLIAGPLFVAAERLLLRYRIDDPVGGTPVHFACGVWGLLSVGLFAEGSRLELAGFNPNHPGLFYSWGEGSFDAHLLLAQFVGAIWICGWTGCLMAPMFLLLNWCGWFRVSKEVELTGLDLGRHGGFAYEFQGPQYNESSLLRQMSQKLEMPGIDASYEPSALEFNSSRHSGRGSVLRLLKNELEQEMKESFDGSSDHAFDLSEDE